MSTATATLQRAAVLGARPVGTSSVERADASSDDLLLAAAQGDQDAFAVLYERVAPSVLGVCTRVLRDRAMAEEVTQEVMVEAWQKAAHFDPERGRAIAWLTTLGHRRAVDRVRSEQAHRDRDVKVARRDQVREFDVVADEVGRSLEYWQVRQALDALTERQREAVELAYFGGHTYRDVAVVLGIPEGTAKSRLRDALERLSRVLEGMV